MSEVNKGFVIEKMLYDLLAQKTEAIGQLQAALIKANEENRKLKAQLTPEKPKGDNGEE